MSGSFKVQLLFGGSFVEACAQHQRAFLAMLSVKLRLVYRLDGTDCRFCSRVLMFLLHIMIKSDNCIVLNYTRFFDASTKCMHI